MAPRITIARESDLDYLAESFAAIVRSFKSLEIDPYIAGLPTAPNYPLARSHIDNPDSIAFVATEGKNYLGCILGSILESSFPAAGLGRVGCIELCWVEAGYRRRGLAARLTNTLENWFREQKIGIVELSYLAQNNDSATAWTQLGYEAFRVYAYKSL